MLRKKTFALMGTAVLGFGLAACGGDDDDTNNANNANNTNNTNNTGFQQPADTVPMSFCVDDTANQTYEAGDGLIWKGSFTYDEATRVLTHDPGWGGGNGPYVPLYDDGPWNEGGHEPAGSTANDSRWCATAFLPIPSEELNFEYGAENAAGWIWVGGNGQFTVEAGRTEEVTAAPLVIQPHGTIDLRLTIDTSTLAEGFAENFDPANDTITVKGSYAAWQEIEAVDDGAMGDEAAGDGVYTFVLSEYAGEGALKHSGLLAEGDIAQFVWVIGGVEYKGEVTGFTGEVPLTQAVMAELSDDGTTWTEATIERQPDGDNNTYVSP